jgi:LPXTG-motif cell wall-anchored protein
VREALDVFALQTGTNSLLKETTAASETISVAPEKGKQCTDGQDNDGDKKIDGTDPGCHTDGNPGNPSSFDPTDDDETDSKTGGSGGGGGGGGGGGNQGSGAGGGGNDGAGNQGAGNGVECADGVDNDGDGVTDENDPGCHSDGNANNPASYNASDDSEGGGAQNLNAGALPFTGTDVIGVALAGLLMLAGGLMLRRREDVRTVR